MSARGPSTQTPVSPAATRSVRSRWRDPRLVLGVALVATCALLGARLLASADDTVGVWTARSTLDAGRLVTGADVVRREVRFADQRAADRYLSAEEALPAGTSLARTVGEGELLPRAALAAGGGARLTEVPLSVETESVPATVRVGTLVDVWVTPDLAVSGAGAAAEGSRAARSTLVFDDVSVVSAPHPGSSLGPTATRQVIVGVAPDQEARLPTSLAALARGSVVLTAQR